MNTDAKILAKILARRLEIPFPLIISVDQTGFIKNRHAYVYISRPLDMVYSPSDEVSECMVSFDAEKAFDRIEWGYLFAVLNSLGFRPNFINWIRLLFSNPSVSVRTNSQMSKSFSLHRGTRQGCPLSPILFDLAIKPLAQGLLGSDRNTRLRFMLMTFYFLCQIQPPLCPWFYPCSVDLANFQNTN